MWVLVPSCVPQNKHPTVPFDPEACTNTHEIYGATTKGVVYVFIYACL
jgi:hypothetical protein